MLLYLFNHRQSVSSMSGPLQVVPDIDDQINNPEHLQEVRPLKKPITFGGHFLDFAQKCRFFSSSSQAKALEESSQYEFENYMRQQLLLAEEKNTIHEAKSCINNRHFGSIPPVRRLGHDAQPVSPLDAAILFLRKKPPATH